jgi:hypothetical protein
MQSHFHVGFDDVRVHRDAEAHSLARAAHAKAFTVGGHVFFRQGAFEPETPGGRRLLAHELAHVVQQRSGALGVQRQVLQRAEDGQRLSEFAAIHFHAMPALLRQLEALLPFSDLDYGLARRHFGPRFVVAMKVVEGTIAAGDPAITALPPDQIVAIQRYLEFARMWAAHPQDYQPSPAVNQSSAEVREEHGLPEQFQNTCAIRVSVMLNRTGQGITPSKASAAGMTRPPFFSEKTQQHYVLGATEMLKYLKKHFRPPDAVLPLTGRYKSATEFREALKSTIEPVVRERKGIVGFESIFGYGGTGHVDLFDGSRLSQAPSWYPCRRLHLWYVVVP